MSLQGGVAKVPSLPRPPVNDAAPYNTARYNRYKVQADANLLSNQPRKPYKPIYAWQTSVKPSEQLKGKELGWATETRNTRPVFSNPRNDPTLMVTEALHRRAIRELAERQEKKAALKNSKPKIEAKSEVQPSSNSKQGPSRTAQVLGKLPFGIYKQVAVPRSSSGTTSPVSDASDTDAKSPQKELTWVTGAFTFNEALIYPQSQETIEGEASEKQEGDEADSPANPGPEQTIVPGAPLTFVVQAPIGRKRLEQIRLQQRALSSGYLVDPSNPTLPARRLTKKQRRRLEEEIEAFTQEENGRNQRWDAGTAFVFKSVGGNGYFLVQTLEESVLARDETDSPNEDDNDKPAPCSAWCWMVVPLDEEGNPIRKTSQRKPADEHSVTNDASDPDIEKAPTRLSESQRQVFALVDEAHIIDKEGFLISSDAFVTNGHGQFAIILERETASIVAQRISDEVFQLFDFDHSTVESLSAEAEIDALKIQGPPLQVPAEGSSETRNPNLFHCDGTGAVYLLLDGQLCRVTDPTTFDRLFAGGLHSERMVPFEDEKAAPHPYGIALNAESRLVKSAKTGEKYILREHSSTVKKLVSEATLLAAHIDIAKARQLSEKDFSDVPTVNSSNAAVATVLYANAEYANLYLAVDGDLVPFESVDAFLQLVGTMPPTNKQPKKKKRKVDSRKKVKRCGIVAVAVSEVGDPTKNDDLLWCLNPVNIDKPKPSAGPQSNAQQYIICNKGYPHLQLGLSEDGIAVLTEEGSMVELRRTKSSISVSRDTPRAPRRAAEHGADQDCEETNEAQDSPDESKEKDDAYEDDDFEDSPKKEEDVERRPDAEHGDKEEELPQDDEPQQDNDTMQASDSKPNQTTDSQVTEDETAEEDHGAAENERVIQKSATETMKPLEAFPPTFTLRAADGYFLGVATPCPQWSLRLIACTITGETASRKVLVKQDEAILFESSPSEFDPTSDLSEWNDTAAYLPHSTTRKLCVVKSEGDSVFGESDAFELSSGKHVIKIRKPATEEIVGEVELELGVDDENQQLRIVAKESPQSAIDECLWKLSNVENSHLGQGVLESCFKPTNATSAEDAPTRFCLTPASSLSGEESWALSLLPIQEGGDSLQIIEINLVKNNQTGQEFHHLCTSVKGDDGVQLAVAFKNGLVVLQTRDAEAPEQQFTLRSA